MKFLELKNRLLVLTFICIISFIAGCDKTPSVETSPAGPAPQTFSAEYYILIDKPKSDDFRALEKYAVSKDHKVASEAANILGYYHMKDEEYDKAMDIFINNYARLGATRYIKTMNELWRMDIALTQNDYFKATVWAKWVERSMNNSETLAGLKTYCSIHNIQPEGSYFSCVEKRISAFRPETTEPLIDSQLNILVTSSTGETGGVLHYYTTHLSGEEGRDFKIRMSKNYREGDWDFILDLDNGYLAGRGYGFYFTPDLKFPLEYMTQYIPLQNCSKILIGFGKNLFGAAKKLKESMTNPDLAPELQKPIELVNVSRGSVANMRKILLEWEKQSFCAVVAGNEEEVNNFVPTVRQYVMDSNMQKVYVLQDMDTGIHYDKNYLMYYGDTNVYPVIDVTLSDDAKQFASEYRLSTGKDVVYETLIGYDMMHFINKLTVHGQKTDADYVTNIIAFHDEKAYRKMRGFYIDRMGKVRKLKVSQPAADMTEDIMGLTPSDNGTVE